MRKLLERMLIRLLMEPRQTKKPSAERVDRAIMRMQKAEGFDRLLGLLDYCVFANSKKMAGVKTDGDARELSGRIWAYLAIKSLLADAQSREDARNRKIKAKY